MSMQDDEVAFDGLSEVLGAEVHLTEGGIERLAKDQLDRPLFPDESEGLEASAGQFLSEYFRQTGTTPKDSVTREMLDEAIRNGASVSKTAITVRVDNPAIKFRRGEELVNFERIVFDLELTVRKHLNS